MPEDYIPPFLENISDKVKTIGIICLRKDVSSYLIKMFKDAEKDGIYLAVTSGYRKPEIQKYLYDFWLSLEGEKSLDEIALPGKSEHQLGTTVDLTDASIGYRAVDEYFEKSDGGKWLMQNAYKYGFIMSYPKDKEKITGYKYEPWHWRFVGVDLATSLYNKGLTFNEEIINTNNKPSFKENIKNGLNISAEAVLSIFIDSNNVEHILIEKNKNLRLPIVNITKLMVALVASDIYKSDDKVFINENALNTKDASGNYAIGDVILFKDAIHALLMNSHNEIAIAIADRIGINEFIKKMNEKAKTLNLNDTQYFNVTGDDPDEKSEAINYSTALDIYKLLKYIFENKSDIFSILQKNEYQLKDINGNLKLTLKNTNKLLMDQSIALRVLGGKTGNTPKAKSNLAIVSEAPLEGKIINVIVHSNDSFQEMKHLLNYIKTSFEW